MSESVAKNDSTLLQSHVNVFAEKSKANGMELKETKCKELRISFSTLNKSFDPIIINNKNVEVVTVVKLLGVTLPNDLKWNSHIGNTCKKVSTRLYFLRQLKRAGLPPEDLIQFYVIFALLLSMLVRHSTTHYRSTCLMIWKDFKNALFA